MNVLENEMNSYIDQPGQYVVTITEAKEDISNAGDEVIKAVFATDSGQTIKSIYTNNKSFGWKLAKLCRACGLTDSQLMNFTPNMIVNKRVSIEVRTDEKDPRYCRVWDTMASAMPDAPKPPKNANLDEVPF